MAASDNENGHQEVAESFSFAGSGETTSQHNENPSGHVQGPRQLTQFYLEASSIQLVS